MTALLQPVAIVGMAALFPDADGTGPFWRNIAAGRDSIREVPPDHWLIQDFHSPNPADPLKIYATRGGFMPRVAFDPLTFGLPPNNLESTDSVQLLALLVAKRLLDDTRSVGQAILDPARIGVVLGLASGTSLMEEMAAKIQRPVWTKVMREQGLPESQVERICRGIEREYVPWSAATFPGMLGNVVAGRITNRFGLGGINCVVDAACASSLAAMSLAVKSLNAGETDLVITGGADALDTDFTFMCFSRTPALSATGDCRPFAADADGTILAEGIGMLALRRLADAERDGDTIYAVIRGVGASSDGHGKSVFAPSVGGQVLALERAYQQAGFGPEEVELIECHGTATRVGDEVELAGLAKAFGSIPARVALGSIKSQIGHAKAASGAAALCKAALALRHKVYPPTLKVAAPIPFPFQPTPFYLNTLKRPWIHPTDTPRRAGVSSFGFGGSNFHAVLEEYRGPVPARFPTAGKALLLFSAQSPAELESRLGRAPLGPDAAGLWHLARELQLDFDPAAACRAAFLAATREEAAEAVERARAGLRRAPDSAMMIPGTTWYLPHLSSPFVAFLFPGQGSQRVQMGADLACEFDQALAVWNAAGAIELEPGARLHHIVYPEPAFTESGWRVLQARLNRTEWAQPAIGAASLAALAVLEAFRIRPAMLGGHSYGELTALHAAGVFPSLETFLRVSRARGEAMAGAAGSDTGMTAVGAPEATCAQWAAACKGEIHLANLNGPRQTVVSGRKEALEQFERELARARVPFQRLPLACPFHSRLLQPAAEAFRHQLAGIPMEPPRLPVYGNTDAAPYRREADAVRTGLVDQIVRPVRFMDQITAMHAAGARVFLEVGPGSIQSRLVQEILGEKALALALDDKGSRGLIGLWSALGALSAAGIPVDYRTFWQAFRPPEIETVPGSKATVALNGVNFGKIYPPKGGATTLPGPNQEPSAPIPEPPGPIQEDLAMSDSPSSSGPDSLARTLEAMQERLCQAQQSYQSAQNEGHLAFLTSMETAFRQLTLIQTPGTAPSPQPEPAAGSESKGPAPEPSRPATAIPAATGDLQATILAVVAEATGYSVDMLDLDLDLEGGLGIDSLKLVQIFTALQERVPEVAGADLSELASLRTVRRILSYAESRSPAPALTEKKNRTVMTYELTPGPVPASFLEQEPPFAWGPVTLMADRRGVAQALGRQFLAMGVTATIRDQPEAGSCLFLKGLDPAGPDTLAETTFQAFQAAQRFGLGHPDQHRLFATVQDLGGTFGLEPGAGARAWTGGLAALTGTAALEWGPARARALDIASEGADPEDIARWILEGLAMGGPATAVGRRRDGTWCSPSLVPRRAGQAELTLEDGEVLLVSGGGRGITGACLLALAEYHRLKFAILGRTPPGEDGGALESLCPEAEPKAKGREVWRLLAALRQAGSEVQFCRADVRDPAAVAAAAREARLLWGRIDGVIHGAGLQQDAFLLRKTEVQFRTVFETKVLGLRNLLAATAGDPLRRIFCFSSAAARFGLPGQVDFAAANEAMSKVCWEEFRRREGRCAVKALDWGPWGGGMVTPAQAETFRQRGMPVMPVAEGTALFVEEVRKGPDPAVEILSWPAGIEFPDRRPKAPLQARITFNRATFPVIDSHRIRGRHVVPMFLVCDLCLRVAKLIHPGRHVAALNQVKVIKGLIIDDFDRGAVTRLEVEEVPADGGRSGLQFTLKNPQGQVHYRLAADLTEAPPADPEPGPEPLALQPLPGTLDEIYGPAGVFHGPAFQCIEPPVYLSDLGFEAFFRGPGQPPQGASPTPDFIRLDGGAQACGIHLLHTNGMRSLPLGFESMRILAADPVPEIRSCRGYLKSMGRLQVLADLHYFDPQGAPVAVVEGLTGLLLGADAWDAPLSPSA